MTTVHIILIGEQGFFVRSPEVAKSEPDWPLAWRRRRWRRSGGCVGLPGRDEVAGCRAAEVEGALTMRLRHGTPTTSSIGRDPRRAVAWSPPGSAFFVWTHALFLLPAVGHQVQLRAREALELCGAFRSGKVVADAERFSFEFIDCGERLPWFGPCVPVIVMLLGVLAESIV